MLEDFARNLKYMPRLYYVMQTLTELLHLVLLWFALHMAERQW